MLSKFVRRSTLPGRLNQDHEKLTGISSIVQLRATCDDNLHASLSELGYTQSFSLIDTKLALGYLTVVIAGLLYVVDKKFGFEKTYNVTVLSVILYFLISGILFYLTSTKKYKNVKYIGYDESNKKILVATWTNKYDPIYHLKIRFNDDESLAIVTSFEFMKVFDAFGYYKQDELTRLLKNELDKINKKSN